MSWTTGVCEKCGAHCEYKMSWGYEKPNGLDYVGGVLLCGDCRKKVASKSSVMRATAILIAGTIAAMGCASPRLAQNNDMAPMRVDADENGAAVMMDVTQGGLVNWIKANPWKAAGTVAAGYGAYRVGDHNDWFQGGSKGDRKATYYHIENHGDNNRYIFVSDYGTGSASGDSNTGSGGQVR